tara:strand:+ start:329 stop:535 length:207 start_codon:yes stop_codon:yes gene_type:complete
MTDKKRIYEVFNIATGEWEESSMTDAEYQRILDRVNLSAEELEAEYKIITRIIEQKHGLDDKSDKSMD